LPHAVSPNCDYFSVGFRVDYLAAVRTTVANEAGRPEIKIEIVKLEGRFHRLSLNIFAS